MIQEKALNISNEEKLKLIDACRKAVNEFYQSTGAIVTAINFEVTDTSTCCGKMTCYSGNVSIDITI